MPDRADPYTGLVTISDVPFDLVAEASEGWEARYRQLEAGPNRGDLTQLRLGTADVALDRIERRVAVTGSAPDERLALGLLADDAGHAAWRGRPVSASTLIFQRPDDEIDLQFAGRLYTFAVQPAALRSALGAQALSRVLNRDRLELPDAAAHGLRHLSRAVLNAALEEPRLVTSAPATRSMADAVVSELRRCLAPLGAADDKRESEPLAIRVRAADRAASFAEAHLDQSIGISDMARAAGVSERTLRKGFVDRFGHGPKKHLTILRLSAVREQLRRPGSAGLSVTEVATRNGFWHLGRFAGAYRRHFGELPSATLRAARWSPARP